ncbi:MAG: SufD family Fe-S cluster assembly protein [Bacilli bacterium]|nr:SufD family Fe-S cluster assembly protein [Bacilli bacterium]
MSDIINSYVFKEIDKLILEENQQKVVYQALNSSFKDLEISLKANSKLELLVYNSESNIKCELLENANLIIYNVSFQKDNYTFNLDVNLQETNAEVHIINLYLGLDKALVTSNIMINHYAKMTKSLLETYAIGKNNAALILNNNAFIKNGMKQSDARQMTRGLNLSKNASIKAQPNLLIDEYDVVASHSASIGSIDKDELFYLMSRGLTETQAQEMVILGFVQPILSHIKNENIQQVIYTEFAKLLK